MISGYARKLGDFYNLEYVPGCEVVNILVSHSSVHGLLVMLAAFLRHLILHKDILFCCVLAGAHVRHW